MYVVQLAVEGMRGFPERVRFGFRGHLDVVRAADRDKREGLIDVLFHTLFPDPDRSFATEKWVIPDSRAGRAVVTVAGKDRRAFRLLRNLASGSVKLYRYDREKNAHHLMSSDIREASQFLRVQMQLPDDASYERLFLFAAGARPSVAGFVSRTGADLFGGAAASGPGRPAGGLQGGLLGASALASGTEQRSELTSAFPLPSVLQESTGVHAMPSGFSMHNALVQHELELSGTADLVAESSDEDLQAKHRELTQSLGRARQRDQAERALGVLAEKETKAETAIAEMRTLAERQEQLRQEIDALQALAQLPPDFKARLGRHEVQKATYLNDRKRVDTEAERLARSLEASPAPWWREPRTVAGLAGAGLCLLGAPLLDLPILGLAQIGFGCLAGWGGLSTLAELQSFEALQDDRRQLEEESQKLERRYSLDTSTVRGMMSRFDDMSTDELVARVERFHTLEAEFKKAEKLLDGAVGARGRRAEAVLEKVRERKARCEATLEKIGDVPALDSLERRLEGLASQLRARGLPVVEAPSSEHVPVVRGQSTIGAADEDEEDGYGPGYGSVSASDDGGWEARPGEGWLAVGGGPLGGGFGGRVSNYGGGDGGGRSRPQLLLEAATDLLGSDPEAVMSTVQPRAERFVSALSSRAVRQVHFTGSGELVLLVEGGERGFDELEGALKDQVDVGLRFALLESVLRVRQVPVFIEEPVASLAPDRRQTLRRIYAHLASMTQLLVLTPANDLEGHVVELD